MNKKLLQSMVLFYCLFLEIAFAGKIHLTPIKHEAQNVIGSNVGIRPYREGGIRIEKESHENTLIIHNYGQGGSGVTLAPGCVEASLDLFHKEDPERRPVSVLGAGYIGLMTADQLSKAGYPVTVYAEQFPTNDYFYQPHKTCITSLVAGGLWLPSTVDGQDEPRFQSYLNRSYTLYKQAIEVNTPGLSWRDAYSFPGLSSPLPQELMERETPQAVEVTFNGSTYFQATKWSTILIDGSLFPHHLYHALQSDQNVHFVTKSFAHRDDVSSLPSQYVFNCTGYGSKGLFEDKALRPVRGQLLYLEPQPSVDYFLFAGDKEKGTRFSIFPSSDKIIVGGTYETDIETCGVEHAQLDGLRQKVASFFEGKIH